MKVFVMGLIAAILSIGILSGCTDEKNAYRVLSANGFTDIKMTGYSWLSCSKNDTFSTGFTAKGPTGIPVKGAVCSGILFKNSTIRFE